MSHRFIPLAPAVLLLAAAPLFADDAEDKAVGVVEKLGGLAVRDEKDPARPVIVVRLNLTKATDADLKELAAMKGLRELDLVEVKVTDAGLKELAALKGLRTLNLGGCRGVTDAGLKNLADLKELKDLNLGLTGVTDAGLKELEALKGLRDLYLYSTKITDAGLKDLADLKELKTLNLYHTPATDAGVKELAGLKALRELNLSGSGVTDAGLKELVALKELRALVLFDTKVTDAGVADFQRALPDCKIAPDFNHASDGARQGSCKAAGDRRGEVVKRPKGGTVQGRRPGSRRHGPTYEVGAFLRSSHVGVRGSGGSRTRHYGFHRAACHADTLQTPSTKAEGAGVEPARRCRSPGFRPGAVAHRLALP